MTDNIDINKTQILHQDLLEKQKNRIYKSTASILSSLQKDLFFVVNNALTLKEQEIEIKKLINETFETIEFDLKNELSELSYYETKFQQNLISSTVVHGLKGEIKEVGKALINATIFKIPIDGELFEDSIRTMSNSLKQQTIKEVKRGVNLGLTPKEIRNSVTAKLNSSAGRYQSFVRTAVQNTTNQARELSYKTNKKFIKSIQIVAIMDSRTTDTCKGYNLKIFPIGEGPRPPFHYNCRTFTIAIFKEEDIISETAIYSDYNPTEGGLELSSDEKGLFKATNESITISKQKEIEEKTLSRKI